MKRLPSGKIVEATRAELMELYSASAYAEVVSFADFLAYCVSSGVRLKEAEPPAEETALF